MAPIAQKKYCRVLYTENIESIQSTSRGIGIKFCALFHEINFVLPSFHMWCHSSWNIWADFLAQAGQRLKILGTCVRKAWEWGYLDRSNLAENVLIWHASLGICLAIPLSFWWGKMRVGTQLESYKEIGVFPKWTAKGWGVGWWGIYCANLLNLWCHHFHKIVF